MNFTEIVYLTGWLCIPIGAVILLIILVKYGGPLKMNLSKDTRTTKNPMTTYLFLLMAAIIVASVALAAPSEAQTSQSCKDASKWHLEQAMKWTQREYQEYHIIASQAANELGAQGYDCTEWSKDRTAVKYYSLEASQ